MASIPAADRVHRSSSSSSRGFMLQLIAWNASLEVNESATLHESEYMQGLSQLHDTVFAFA